MSKSGRDFCNYRIEQMRSERSSWVPHWRELNRNFSPRRGKFDRSDTNKGNKRNQLSNNTPLFAKRTLRAGMMTGVTSPARPWFKLGPPDPEMADFGPVRGWLDDVQAAMYRVFASSGLYRALPSIYEEAGVIGTAALLQEENFENVTSFQPFTVGEFMLDMNGDNKIDTFAREYQMTVHQIVSKFGIDNVSPRIKTLYDNGNYSSWVPVRHIIEPNEKQLEGINVPDSFEFRSIYYEESMGNDEDWLAATGYHEFPIHAPRWDTKPGDIYGISPGMDALGDSYALQVQEREVGKAIAKMVSPPTTAPAALKDTQVSLMPGANNFTDDPNNVFKAIYQVKPQVEHLEMKIGKTEDRINRAFYVDMFLMIQNDDRLQRATATEIAEKHEEKLLQLGPVLENMNDDLLDPTINRTFNMMVRASEDAWNGRGNFMMIPPPPPEMEGKELNVEYISILSQAQKMVATGAMERWVGFVGNLAALGKPNALDKVNEDELADVMAADLGVPNKVVYTDKEVVAIRKARAQKEQALEQQAMMAQAAESVKTLSESPTTGGSVLTDVLGVGA